MRNVVVNKLAKLHQQHGRVLLPSILILGEDYSDQTGIWHPLVPSFPHAYVKKKLDDFKTLVGVSS